MGSHHHRCSDPDEDGCDELRVAEFPAGQVVLNN